MKTTSNPTLGTALSTLGRLLTQPIGSSGRKPESPRATSASGAGAGERRPSVSVGHRQMRRELYTLLERHPSTRQTMRHLNVVERTLRRDSIDAVQALPVKVLARALDELESLVWDWSAAGLAEVRSRLAVTIKRRQHEKDEAVTTTVVAELAEDHPNAPILTAEVSEVSHDLFEEMERSWTGQMSAELAAAVRAAREAESGPPSTH